MRAKTLLFSSIFSFISHLFIILCTVCLSTFFFNNSLLKPLPFFYVFFSFCLIGSLYFQPSYSDIFELLSTLSCTDSTYCRCSASFYLAVGEGNPAHPGIKPCPPPHSTASPLLRNGATTGGFFCFHFCAQLFASFILTFLLQIKAVDTISIKMRI